MAAPGSWRPKMTDLEYASRKVCQIVIEFEIGVAHG
jgi:hypothetical protein